MVQVYDLPVRQNLLVLPGARPDRHPPRLQPPAGHLPERDVFEADGPALHRHGQHRHGAKFVAESGDRSKAAIASRETAALYGLEVLVPDINTDGDNTTRFIVISREKPTRGNRFSLLFTVDNKPGKLAAVIQKIGASGFQHGVHQESRPMPHMPFEYYFYAELVGDPARAESEALLRELDRTCRTVRMLGVYTK